MARRDNKVAVRTVGRGCGTSAEQDAKTAKNPAALYTTPGVSVRLYLTENNS